MRCFLGLLMLGMVLVAGCAVQMREIHPGTLPAELDRVNAELGPWRGRAVLQNGDTLRGSRFSIEWDSTFWYASHTRERRAFPNADIRNVSVVTRTGSSWTGFWTGALGGSIGGALVGTLAGVGLAVIPPRHVDYSPLPPDSLGHILYDRSHQDTDNRWVWVPLGALVGAAVGGTVGGAVGAFVPQLGQPIMVNFRFPLDKPRASRAPTSRSTPRS
jgi:hypothetical protein